MILIFINIRKMRLISIDLVILLLVLYIINKFKLNTKMINYLLKSIRIFIRDSKTLKNNI